MGKARNGKRAACFLVVTRDDVEAEVAAEDVDVDDG